MMKQNLIHIGKTFNVEAKRIYVVGPIGSGKTFFSKKMSKKLKIPCYQEDYVVFSKNYKTKKWEVSNDNKIDRFIQSILRQKEWIIEGVGQEKLQKVHKKTELFILLEPNVIIRIYRIIKRFLKRKMKKEIYGHEKDLTILNQFKFVCSLIKATIIYKRETYSFLQTYSDKTIILKKNKEIKNFEKKWLYKEGL